MDSDGKEKEDQGVDHLVGRRVRIVRELVLKDGNDGRILASYPAGTEGVIEYSLTEGSSRVANVLGVRWADADVIEVARKNVEFV